MRPDQAGLGCLRSLVLRTLEGKCQILPGIGPLGLTLAQHLEYCGEWVNGMMGFEG